ncbi:hypothetical protein AAXE64_07515 [Priestia megaterium]
MKKCRCGRELELLDYTIKTYYKEKEISIHNVPTYLCNKDHVEFARKTRIRVRELLKNAYDNNLDKINYNSKGEN